MKRLKKWLMPVLVCLCVAPIAFVLAGCSADVQVQGPKGDTGATGAQGEPGTPGDTITIDPTTGEILINGVGTGWYGADHVTTMATVEEFAATFETGTNWTLTFIDNAFASVAPLVYVYERNGDLLSVVMTNPGAEQTVEFYLNESTNILYYGSYFGELPENGVWRYTEIADVSDVPEFYSYNNMSTAFTDLIQSGKYLILDGTLTFDNPFGNGLAQLRFGSSTVVAIPQYVIDNAVAE